MTRHRTQYSRRRALVLLASAGGLPLGGAVSALASGRKTSVETIWTGSALGAAAQLRLRHPDTDAATRMLSHCLSEVSRLESVFSLYREDSELSRLNSEGRLGNASLDLRYLLGKSQHVAMVTGGAFDVTVQPLFRLYADHFATGAKEGPSARHIAAARQRVAYEDVDVSSGGAGFLKDGMAATMNGIAQGYITDRIADMLRNEGFDHVLLQLGETVGIAPSGRREAWRVAIPHPIDGRPPAAVLDLADMSSATSSGASVRFDPDGTRHHIFDPRSGHSAQRYAAVTVVAQRATVADALSTGLSSMPEHKIPAALKRGGAVRAILVGHDGKTRYVEAAETG